MHMPMILPAVAIGVGATGGLRRSGMSFWTRVAILPVVIVGRGERPAGRAELLAKWQHTDRLQNPAKLRRFRIGGRIGGGIGAG